MSENIPTIESSPEKNPNEGEVLNQFEKILGTREYQEIAKVEDEEGLLSWDIQTTEEGTGDRVDIGYIRGKVLPNGVVTVPRINQTLYYKEVPCGAGIQYDYVNGEWVVHP